MKYLIFTFLIIFGSATLSAQDTLYVKGKEEPLLVSITIIEPQLLTYRDMNGEICQLKMKNVKEIKRHKFTNIKSVNKDASAFDKIYLKGKKEPLLVYITAVKKNTLNYTKRKGGGLHTIRMEDVEEIKYKEIPFMVYPEFDEFQSTIFVNSSGVIRYYLGLNYLYHLKGLYLKKKRHKFFINIGGGYYNRQQMPFESEPAFIDLARGVYFEYGARFEFRNLRKPRSRFHVGLEANHRWEARTTFSYSFETDITTREFSNLTKFAIQVPIGYTFRSPKGFYYSAGLEVTTEKVLPAYHIGLGFAFGKSQTF